MPQQYARLLVATAQLWKCPVLTARYKRSPATLLGAVRIERVPSPFWPWVPSPQQNARPSVVTPQVRPALVGPVWSSPGPLPPPASTCRHRYPPATRVGFLRQGSVLKVTWQVPLAAPSPI